MTTGSSGRLVAFIFIAVYRRLIQEQMDEREAFQRMQRLELGSDAPMYANLGRYYEPFEEIVAPISAQALEYAFPPYPPNTSAPSGPFGAGVPMGRAPLSHEFPRVEDISPIQNDAYLDAWLPQVFWPTPISPTLALNSPAIPASPTRIRRASLAEPEATRIDSLPVEDWNPIDGVKEDTKEYREDSEGEHRYAESTGEEEGYAAPGPSNRRGGKSIRRRREESAPYSVGGSTSKPPRKPRVVSDEDDFPHPSIPNPDGAREQAGYNTGKHKWWSQRVLRPLLSASPKPLSKDAILSIIKKDLGLEGDAWQAFHDQHLVRTSLL